MSHNPCRIKFILWINPLSQNSLTPLTTESIKELIGWIDYVYGEMVNESIESSQGEVGSTDFIHPSVFVSSVLDLFLGFMTRNKVPLEDYLCLLLSIYRFIIDIYDEIMMLYPSNIYQYLLHDLCSPLSYQKYYHQIVKFINYDPYSYPLSINYITYSDECLNINFRHNNKLLNNFYCRFYEISLEPSSYLKPPIRRIIDALRKII